jgi:hypothetical protein
MPNFKRSIAASFGGGPKSIDDFMTTLLPHRTMRIPKFISLGTIPNWIASAMERDHSAPRLASTRWVSVIA